MAGHMTNGCYHYLEPTYDSVRDSYTMTLPRTYEKEEIMTFFPFLAPIRGTKTILKNFTAIFHNHSTQMLKSRRHGPM